MKLKIMNQEKIEKAIFRGTFIIMIIIVIIGLIILLSEIGIIRNEYKKLIFTKANSVGIENFDNPIYSTENLDPKVYF